jgi:hypothetical protein
MGLITKTTTLKNTTTTLKNTTTILKNTTTILKNKGPQKGPKFFVKF